MRIERYFYSEAVEAEQKRMAALLKHPPKEWKDTEDTFPEELSEGETEDKIHVAMLDPKRVKRFERMAVCAEDMAMELEANLWIDSNEQSGCITFLAEELHLSDEMKMMFQTMAGAADEIAVRSSVDTGNGSPMDVDGMIQLEFWFDLHSSIEAKEI